MPREINIPFPGFYYSRLADVLDSAAESEAENRREKESSTYYEEYEPIEELRLGDFYSEKLWEYVDYSAAHKDIAEDYADLFNVKAEEYLGFPLNLTFAAMTSPRYYNFETDRLFCNVSDETMRQLFAYSRDKDEHATFKRLIEERHTSRSGFHSFYSNDLADWLTDDAPDRYDHNEACTLLLACLELADAQDIGDEIEEALWEGNYEYLDRHLDWHGFEKACAERKDDLRAEYAEAHGLPIEALPYRCPETPDLFAEKRTWPQS